MRGFVDLVEEGPLLADKGSGLSVDLVRRADEQTIHKLQAVAVRTFRGLNRSAAARQCPTKSEFDSSMRNPNIIKAICSSGHGKDFKPRGLVQIFTDPGDIAWLNTESLRRHYCPDPNKNTFLYIGMIAIDSGGGGVRAVGNVLEGLIDYASDILSEHNESLRLGLSCCQANDPRLFMLLQRCIRRKVQIKRLAHHDMVAIDPSQQATSLQDNSSLGTREESDWLSYPGPQQPTWHLSKDIDWLRTDLAQAHPHYLSGLAGADIDNDKELQRAVASRCHNGAGVLADVPRFVRAGSTFLQNKSYLVDSQVFASLEHTDVS